MMRSCGGGGRNLPNEHRTSQAVLSAHRSSNAGSKPFRLERRRSMLSPVRALEQFIGMSSLMKPEIATIFSATVAVISVSLNLYGGLLQERSKSELQKEVGALLSRRHSCSSMYEKTRHFISNHHSQTSPWCSVLDACNAQSVSRLVRCFPSQCIFTPKPMVTS